MCSSLSELHSVAAAFIPFEFCANKLTFFFSTGCSIWNIRGILYLLKMADVKMTKIPLQLIFQKYHKDINFLFSLLGSGKLILM